MNERAPFYYKRKRYYICRGALERARSAGQRVQLFARKGSLYAVAFIPGCEIQVLDAPEDQVAA